MNSRSSSMHSQYGRTVLAGAFFAFAAQAANAQSVEARCEKMLPLKTLTAVAGAGFTAFDAVERTSGELECSWMSRSSGSIKTLFVGHKNKAAISNWGSSFTPAKGGDDWWDSAVTGTEAAMSAKRQLIPSLGKRAALVTMPSGGQSKIFIQRDAEVIEVVSMGVGQSDLTKAAKALASP